LKELPLNMPCRLALASCIALSLGAQELQANLYRPTESTLIVSYPPAQVEERTPLSPMLHLYGKDFHQGKGTLAYRVLGGGKALAQGTLEVTVGSGGVLETALNLETPCAGADKVEWTLTQGADSRKGTAKLAWSRFEGRIDYADGLSRPAYIQLIPHTFGNGTLMIPVRADGTFEAEVPARTYAVLNANSAGYAYDALERWGWEFDLTRDRKETFRIGRTELYGMHASQMVGGGGTVFVTFRPTSLTRFLHHRSSPTAAPKDEASMNMVTAHLKLDPMAMAPRLTREGTKVWLDGVPCETADLTPFVEREPHGYNQTLYLLQFHPPKGLARGMAHEVKVEVESQDVLDGRLYTDFGQGTCGLRLD
jgi:hypothetical protein